MEKEAIQPDAIEEMQGGDAQESLPDQETRVKSRREEAMEAIAARRDAERGQQSVPFSEAYDDEVSTRKDEIKPDVPQSQKVKLKVDGVEIEEDLDKLIRERQKNLSADKRLAEAATLRKQLEQYEVHLRAKEAQLSKMAQPTQEAKRDVSSLKKVAAELRSAIYEAGEDDNETDERIANALASIAQPQVVAPPVINQEQMERQIMRKIQHETQYNQRVEEGNRLFREQYAHLNEPKWADLVNRFTMEYPTTADPLEVIRESAERAQELFEAAGGQKLASQQTTLRPTPPRVPPKTVGLRTKFDDGQEQKPLTREQAIAEMRRARGLPT